MWDGFIIGLAVTRLPCRAPSSVWRINLLSFFPPPALHTSRLRISYSSPNSVSCHREWLCNLMKWGKRAKKKKRKANCTSCISGSALNENAVDDAVVVECGTEEADSGSHKLTHSHPHMPRSTTALHCRLLSDYTVEGLWGQCLAQGRFSSCYWGREEYYMLGLSRSGTKHKLFYSGLFFISRRSKARHYVKLLIQHKRVCVSTCQWAVFTLVSSLTHGLSSGHV